MKRIVLLVIVFSALGCASRFDTASRAVSKEQITKNRKPLFYAKLRDQEKGYWDVYIMEGNRFQIAQTDSMPTKRGKLRLYAGTFVTDQDTLKLSFIKNHVIPNFEYVRLNEDTLLLKLSSYKEPLRLVGKHTK